jgi:hypothetical protein
MFGFWSFLPLSTSDTTYYNGRDYGFILYIQQDSPLNIHIEQSVRLDLTIQKNNIIIL